MVRDFDFVSSSRQHRPIIQPQAPAPRPIPPENVLDLRQQPPTPVRPVRAAQTTLRNYYPLTPKPATTVSPRSAPTHPYDRAAAHPRPNPAQQYSQPAPQQAHTQPATQHKATQEAQKTKKKSWLAPRSLLATALCIVGIVMLASGLMTPLLQNPHVAIAIYIPIALIFKLKSQTSFTLALLLLVAIPILIVLKQEALAETYAVFCFYFLVLGVVMAAFELRGSKRRVSL